MRISRIALAAVIIMIIMQAGCATRVRVVELENKGTSLGVSTPDWIRIYVSSGITRLQSQNEFRDKYCVIGEESGVNRQFVVTWADNFSAQQRIGAMLRTNIASEYQARMRGASQSVGGGNASSSYGSFQQEIDSVINTIVNVSYSGAQREADWWSLNRRYDPDQKDVFSDSYTAYVLYTIPKAELNRQVAHALETSVRADSALYEITIQMSKQILQNGLANWGAH